MKRFHASVSVTDLDRSLAFYTDLFGAEPTVLQADYAKWMLDDPRINFSINLSDAHQGLNHIGLQVDTLDELEDIRARVRDTGEYAVEQKDAECCYAKSNKTWVRDPDRVVWEMFVTHGAIEEYGDDREVDTIMGAANDCCKAGAEAGCCI